MPFTPTADRLSATLVPGDHLMDTPLGSTGQAGLPATLAPGGAPKGTLLAHTRAGEATGAPADWEGKRT